MKIRYVEIIPTHRPNFVWKAIKSILKQTSLPDKIYVIADYKYKLDELTLRKIIASNSLEELIEIVPSRRIGGEFTAIDAFKNCFIMARLDNEQNIFSDNYYHILEDDVSYIRKTAIQRYRDLIKEGYDFIYSPLMDLYNNNICSGELVLNPGLKPITKIPDNILDTCSMIFKSTMVNLNSEWIDFVKDRDYVLNGDMYFFSWCLTSADNPISLNETLLTSNIHCNQVTGDLELQLQNTSYAWYMNSPKKIKRLVKLEARLMDNFMIRAYVKYFNINLEDTIAKKPTKSFVKEYLKINNIKRPHQYTNLVYSSETIRNQFEHPVKQYHWFFNKHKEEVKYILGIELKEKLDYHPDLDDLKELR